MLAPLIWIVAVWFASRRRARPRPEDYSAHLYRTQTRGMGLRLTEWLRDRLRPGWLHIRRERGADGAQRTPQPGPADGATDGR